jgi:hypothetical protein
MFYGAIEEEYNSFINEAVEFLINESIDRYEGFGALLRPIYVILLYSDTLFDKIGNRVLREKPDYWHAALAFAPGLDYCYSFNYMKDSTNLIKGGLSFESLDGYKQTNPDSIMQVGLILIGEEKYKRIKDLLYKFIKNKEKTKYGFIDLIYNYFKIPKQNKLSYSLVCSSFVDTILKYNDIYINKKPINLTRPDDLMYTDGKKYFQVFKGLVKDYNWKKVANITEELANNPENDFFY